jgi:rhodanese-related sulfurtransferase
MIIDDHRVIDTRNPDAFASKHIPGTVNLALGNMGLLAGWALRPNQTFSFVLGESSENQEDRHLEASTYLYRIGFDQILGYLDGGIHAWTRNDRPTVSFKSLSIEDLAQRLGSPDFILADVREPHEYEAEHIENSISYPLTSIEETDIAQFRGKDVAMICPSGFRSMAGASLLARKGVKSVSVPLGGLKEWKAKGHGMKWKV